MADFYLDISAVGNEYEAYNDTPTTWGVPQDGNGKAGPGHSAAVAIATIDCTSAVGDGAQTLSILGITVSNSSAGSGATLAASLVTSINGTATATTATYCQALLPLNKLIFARQKPDELAKVQVMLRIAGADWNSITTTHAGFTTGPTITDFAGGVDGPFGYINNGSTVFGKTAGTYGVFVAKPNNPTDLTINDPIIVRTSRSGSALTLTCNANFNSANYPRKFIFDDGTTWTGDNGQLVITTNGSIVGSGNGGKLILIARQKYSLKFLLTNTGMVRVGHYDGSYGGWHLFQNTLFEFNNSSGYFRLNPDGNFSHAAFVGCYLLQKRTGTMSLVSGGSPISLSFLDTTLEWQGVSGNEPGLFSLGTAALSVTALVSIINCRFLVGGGNYRLASIYTNLSIKTAFPGIRTIVENCEGLISTSAGFVGEQATYPWSRNQALLTTRDTLTQSQRYETPEFTSDWMLENAGAYPTLGATTRLGSPMGFRFSWEYARLTHSLLNPLEVLAVSTFLRDGSAAKTCTLELLVPSAEIPSKNQLAIVLNYTDSSGFLRTENTLLGGDTALADGIGLGSWTLNGITGVSSKKLSITTSYAIKTLTEIHAKLFITGNPPAGTHTIYVSPELRLS